MRMAGFKRRRRRLRRPLRRQSLPLGVDAGGHGVDGERDDGGEHRDKAGERKLMPRLLRQALRRQHLEGVRQHVHESGAEYDAGGERLHDGEEVALRAQGLDGARQQRQANADHARHEDRDDRDDLQRQRRLLVVAAVPLAGAARRRNRLDPAGKIREDGEEDRNDGGCALRHHA